MAKNTPAEKASSGYKVVALNKKARFRYEVLETFEAGISLTGSEIKSIRQGNVNLTESYIRPKSGELLLVGAHITQYSHDTSLNYDPIRVRKLLMHKREIARLQSKVEQKGHTLVPLKIYLKRGMAKLELALARGKSAPDKRRSIQEREQGIEMQRVLKSGKR